MTEARVRSEPALGMINPRYPAERQDPGHYSHVRDLPIRTEDLSDRSRHVMNTAAYQAFEAARSPLLSEMFAEGPGWAVMAEARLFCLNEAFPPGPLHVHTRVAGFGRSSILLEQAIFLRGVCHFLCDATYVHIGDARRPIPVPPKLRLLWGSSSTDSDAA